MNAPKEFAAVSPAALTRWQRRLLKESESPVLQIDERTMREIRASRRRQNIDYIGRSKRWERRA